ncbi:MAG: hypothetical protein M1830_001641 [Pleopsidium flavum]|nr:MAG: hypothetical protein M1830_001641 [Pleopsidium flavum]
MKLREMTAFMLSMGANPNRSYTSDKDTFLGVAAEVESPDSLNLLTEHGARVEGSQALRYATKVFTKTVYYPAKEEAWGYALHFAVEGKQVEFVRFLLSVVPKQTN